MRGLKMMIVFFLVAVLWWIFWSCGGRGRHEDVGRAIDEGRRVNMLVLSTDLEESLAAAALISYEPLSRQTVIFHVPTTLCMDGTFEDSSTAGAGGGANLSTTLEASFARDDPDRLGLRLSKVFGPDLTLTAVVPAEKFLRLINLMGGIFVNVPARISFRSAASAGRAPGRDVDEWIEIPQGEEVFFDAEKTRMYLSYRYDGLGPRGQAFRAKRLAAAFIQHLKPHLEYDWFRKELMAAFSQGLPDAHLRLLQAMAETPYSSIDVRPMPGQPDLNSGVFWMSRRQWIAALPRELKPLIMADSPKSRITLQILNGSGTPHIAAALREKLSAYPDVDIVELGNASRQDFEATEIIDRAGHMRAAERIRELLGAGILRQDVNPRAMLDVTVIVGKDVR